MRDLKNIRKWTFCRGQNDRPAYIILIMLLLLRNKSHATDVTAAWRFRAGRFI